MITTATKRKTIGQLLIAKGIVTQQILDAVLAQQKAEGGNRHKLVGEILLEQGLVSEEQLLETLAEAYGVPYAKVSPKICDPKCIELLPREFVEKHVVLPMFLVKNTLTVALAEPSNLFLIEEIQQLTGYQVQVVASSPRDIANTMQARRQRLRHRRHHRRGPPRGSHRRREPGRGHLEPPGSRRPFPGHQARQLPDLQRRARRRLRHPHRTR
jgi:hypothetical protein